MEVLNIINISYGKDSLAQFGACEKLGIPVHGAVHAEVWATDTIPADLPPMVEFKTKADRIIKDRWGIEVKHVCAMWGGAKNTYQRTFYREVTTERARARAREYDDNLKCHNNGKAVIYGFPITVGAWCNSKLKVSALNWAKENIRAIILQDISERQEGGQIQGFPISTTRGNYCTSLKTDIRISDSERELVQRTENASTKFSLLYESEVVQLLGIASDEPERIERHQNKKGIRLPLVEAGWNEEYCKQWCIENDLLSPIYTDECTRGGCWFCHNQGVNQLRILRRDYPDLWQLLLKWDSDSPTTFKADGHTVHDYERRFKAEDEKFISKDDRFYWNDLDMQQYNIFHYI